MIKPMLAYKVGKKEIDWSAKNFIQPKLDGVRCIFTKNGAYSRTGKEFKNVAHIEEDLKDFFNDIFVLGNFSSCFKSASYRIEKASILL